MTESNDQACHACGYVVCKPGCAGATAKRLCELGCEVTECGEQLQVIEPSGALRSGAATDREFWDALIVHLEGVKSA